jgi:hypothetical protein
MQNRVKSYFLDQDPAISSYIDLCGAIQGELFQTDAFNRNEEGYSYLAIDMLTRFQEANDWVRVDVFHYVLMREYLWVLDHYGGPKKRINDVL